MTPRYRHSAATLLAVGCTCLVAACGSSSSSSSGSGSTAGGPGGAQGVGLKLTATEESCLKKHGATVFTGGAHGPGGRSGFKPGKGFKPGSGAKGGPPSGAARGRLKRGTAPGGFGAGQRGGKQQAAFKACGVSLPSGRSGGSSAPPAG